MQPSAPPHLESTETIFSSSITKLVVFICWLAILADGYDLGIYGAVLPKLLEDKKLGAITIARWHNCKLCFIWDVYWGYSSWNDYRSNWT